MKKAGFLQNFLNLMDTGDLPYLTIVHCRLILKANKNVSIALIVMLIRCLNFVRTRRCYSGDEVGVKTVSVPIYKTKEH